MTVQDEADKYIELIFKNLFPSADFDIAKQTNNPMFKQVVRVAVTFHENEVLHAQQVLQTLKNMI